MIHDVNIKYKKMSTTGDISETNNKLFHYFSIIGLKQDVGLKPFEGSSSEALGNSIRLDN